MQLPSDFITRTKPLLNNDWSNFVLALDAEAPTSIRINTAKWCDRYVTCEADKVPWCPTACYLDKRPRFTFDPLFHAGCYYVQEASSMFVHKALQQYVSGDVRILDLCAAPGGKSTLIADSLSDGSLLVSNEVIRSRANILAENMTKWGRDNVVVTNNDPADIGSRLQHYFDVVLVDAPCSGEGMFRKDASAIDEWSADNVKLCKERQQRILADIWPALKSGGLLLYSTCTYNIEENEDNLRWISTELGADVLPLDVEADWAISDSYIDGLPAYHFFQHKVRGEGFFLAVLQKHDSEVMSKSLSAKKNRGDKKATLADEYKAYLTDPSFFSFYEQGTFWWAFRQQLFDDLLLIKAAANIVSAGICLGEFKGRDFLPSQSLAMSCHLNVDAFECCEVDWQTAIAYLRKEALVLDNKPKGYLLLTYRSTPLGFVKNIGNRANNVYPQEWRIRSAAMPDGEVRVL